MTDTRRLLATFGYAAPAVSISFVFLATVLDPKFSWQSRSLSSIGEATGTSLFALSSTNQIAFNLFNAGLFLAGVLGLPFVLALWYDAEKRAERISTGLLTVTLLGNLGVGVAYLDGPFAGFHFPAAMTLFFGIALTIWVHSTGQIQRTGGERGLLFLWLSNVYVLIWVVWIVLETLVFTADGDTWTWFAVPEFIGAVLLGVWVAFQANRLLTTEPTA